MPSSQQGVREDDKTNKENNKTGGGGGGASLSGSTLAPPFSNLVSPSGGTLAQHSEVAP